MVMDFKEDKSPRLERGFPVLNTLKEAIRLLLAQKWLLLVSVGLSYLVYRGFSFSFMSLRPIVILSVAGLVGFWIRVPILGAEPAWRQPGGTWARMIFSMALRIFVLYLALWLMQILILEVGLWAIVAIIPIQCLLFAAFSETLVEAALDDQVFDRRGVTLPPKGMLGRLALIMAMLYAPVLFFLAAFVFLARIPILGLILGQLVTLAALVAIAAAGAVLGVAFTFKYEQATASEADIAP